MSTKEKRHLSLEYRPTRNGEGVLGVVSAESSRDDKFESAIGVTKENRDILLQFLGVIASAAVLARAISENKQVSVSVDADQLPAIMSKIAP